MAKKILGVDNLDVIRDFVLSKVMSESDDIKRVLTEENAAYLQKKLLEAAESLKNDYESKYDNLYEQLEKLKQDGADIEAIKELELRIDALNNNYIDQHNSLKRIEDSIADIGDSVMSPGQLNELVNTALIEKTTITDDMIETPNLYTKNLVALIAKFGTVRALNIIGDEIEGKTISAYDKIDGTNEPTWKLDRQGNGYLANKNISWDKNGNVTFGDKVKIKWGSVTDTPDDFGSGTSVFTSTVFKRTNTKPSKPTGGSFSNPIPDDTTWTDGIPDGSEILWAATRVFASDGGNRQQAEWTGPSQMTDTETFDVEFSSVVTNPGNPTDNPSNWSNDGDENTIWMATATISNGVHSDWTVTKIKGEDGKDGKDGKDGVDGVDGKDGKDGTSISIAGYFDTEEELWAAYPDGPDPVTNAYVVGNDLYVWTSGSWKNVGQFTGKDGKDGAQVYLHIKYAESVSFDMSGNVSQVALTGNNGENRGPWQGMYSDYTEADSNDVKKYKWFQIDAEKAVQTEFGKYNITSNTIVGKTMYSTTSLPLANGTEYITFDGEGLETGKVTSDGTKSGPAWQIKNHGDGYLAAGNIRWDSSGNLLVNGKINGNIASENGDTVGPWKVSKVGTTTTIHDGNTQTASKTYFSSDNSFRIGGTQGIRGSNAGGISIGDTSGGKGISVGTDGSVTFGDNVKLSWGNVDGPMEEYKLTANVPYLRRRNDNLTTNNGDGRIDYNNDKANDPVLGALSGSANMFEVTVKKYNSETGLYDLAIPSEVNLYTQLTYMDGNAEGKTVKINGPTTTASGVYGQVNRETSTWCHLTNIRVFLYKDDINRCYVDIPVIGLNEEWRGNAGLTEGDVTKIIGTTITKDYVESLQVRATDIIGDTITGKTIKSSGDKWYIGKDGDGKLANGNITWDANGGVTFGSGVKLNWSTNINDDSGFSSSISAAAAAAAAAQSTADTAKSTADTAKSTADTAKSTAETVSSTLSALQTRVNQLNNYSEDQIKAFATTITNDTVTTAFVNALGITADSVAAEKITGNTIQGKTIKNTNGTWEINNDGTFILGGGGGINFDGNNINFGKAYNNKYKWSINKYGQILDRTFVCEDLCSFVNAPNYTDKWPTSVTAHLARSGAYENGFYFYNSIVPNLTGGNGPGYTLHLNLHTMCVTGKIITVYFADFGQSSTPTSSTTKQYTIYLKFCAYNGSQEHTHQQLKFSNPESTRGTEYCTGTFTNCSTINGNNSFTLKSGITYKFLCENDSESSTGVIKMLPCYVM